MVEFGIQSTDSFIDFEGDLFARIPSYIDCNNVNAKDFVKEVEQTIRDSLRSTTRHEVKAVLKMSLSVNKLFSGDYSGEVIKKPKQSFKEHF